MSQDALAFLHFVYNLAKGVQQDRLCVSSQHPWRQHKRATMTAFPKHLSHVFDLAVSFEVNQWFDSIQTTKMELLRTLFAGQP